MSHGWQSLINKLRGKDTRRSKTRLLALRVARWLDYSGGETDIDDVVKGLRITGTEFNEAMRELRKDRVADVRGGRVVLLRASKMRVR